MAKPRKTNAQKAIRKVASLEVVQPTDDSKIEVVEIKKPNIAKAREYLAQNKVFFETLAATTLTVMAIIVAVAQLLVMNKQTVYLEQQTTIGRSQALPHFVITAKQFMNDDNTYAVSDKILIYNQGNIAYNITAQTAVFFELSYLKGANLKDQRIPVSGYYTVQFFSGDATGLVITVDSMNNNLKRANIQDELSNLAKTNDASILLNVKRYIQLTYRDIFNELHTEYYFVPLIFGGTLMDSVEAEPIFAEYDKNRGYMLDLDTMTAEDLYNLFR